MFGIGGMRSVFGGLGIGLLMRVWMCRWLLFFSNAVVMHVTPYSEFGFYFERLKICIHCLACVLGLKSWVPTCAEVRKNRISIWW